MFVFESSDLTTEAQPEEAFFKRAWTFFALTLAWTCAFWLGAALIGLGADTLPGLLLLSLGGMSPALAAVYLTLRESDRSRRRDFWLRIVDTRRIQPVWYLVILLTAPLISLLAIATRAVLTGEPYSFEHALSLSGQPQGLLLLVLAVFFFGPLPEEPGWRGFALERLQSRWSGVVSSLVLAAVWAIWHIPLFFIPGTYQQYLGFGTPGFWLFMASLFPETVLMTWIFNNTRRSTLSAVLYHFMLNFTGQFMDPAQGFAGYRLFWTAVMAVGVILISGKDLGKD